jgi:hypothetical protein
LPRGFIRPQGGSPDDPPFGSGLCRLIRLFTISINRFGGIEAKFSLGFLLGFYGRIVLLAPSKYRHSFLHWVVWATVYKRVWFLAKPPSGRICWICTHTGVPGAVGALPFPVGIFKGGNRMVPCLRA